MPLNLDQSGRKENFTRGERERGDQYWQICALSIFVRQTNKPTDRHDLFKIGKGTQSEAIEMKKIVAMFFTIE